MADVPTSTDVTPLPANASPDQAPPPDVPVAPTSGGPPVVRDVYPPPDLPAGS